MASLSVAPDSIRYLLKPAVRFCLLHGISATAVLELLKAEFISEAQKEIAQQREKITSSRLSVMTGLQRREIAKLQAASDPSDLRETFVQRVLGQWEQDRRFLTKAGRPRVLSYGFDDSEFTMVVRSVSKDINPAAMLAELERIGAVEKTKTGLKLVSVERSYAEDPEKGYALLARDIESLLAGGEENLQRKVEPKNLHLRTEFDNIFEDDLPKIREWLLKHGSQFHKEVREFLSGHDNDIDPRPNRKGGATVVVKAFSWTKPGR